MGDEYIVIRWLCCSMITPDVLVNNTILVIDVCQLGGSSQASQAPGDSTQDTQTLSCHHQPKLMNSFHVFTSWEIIKQHQTNFAISFFRKIFNCEWIWRMMTVMDGLVSWCIPVSLPGDVEGLKREEFCYENCTECLRRAVTPVKMTWQDGEEPGTPVLTDMTWVLAAGGGPVAGRQLSVSAVSGEYSVTRWWYSSVTGRSHCYTVTLPHPAATNTNQMPI